MRIFYFAFLIVGQRDSTGKVVLELYNACTVGCTLFVQISVQYLYSQRRYEDHLERVQSTSWTEFKFKAKSSLLKNHFYLLRIEKNHIETKTLT